MGHPTVSTLQKRELELREVKHSRSQPQRTKVKQRGSRASFRPALLLQALSHSLAHWPPALVPHQEAGDMPNVGTFCFL